MPTPQQHAHHQRQIRQYFLERGELVIKALNDRIDGPDCALCNDADWWAENGFSEAERQHICGPQGLQCPGFGDPQG